MVESNSLEPCDTSEKHPILIHKFIEGLSKLGVVVIDVMASINGFNSLNLNVSLVTPFSVMCNHDLINIVFGFYI